MLLDFNNLSPNSKCWVYITKNEISKSELKIYIGENHPHSAQNPEIIEIKNLNNKNIIRN